MGKQQPKANVLGDKKHFGDTLWGECGSDVWDFLRQQGNWTTELFSATQLVFCNLTLLGDGIIAVIEREKAWESHKNESHPYSTSDWSYNLQK